MKFKEYLSRLEEADELKIVETTVSPDLELAALCRREFQTSGGGSALLFKNVAGSHFSAVANLFGSEKRAALLLHTSSLEQFEAKLNSWLSSRSGTVTERLKNISAASPNIVSNSETQQVATKLTALPAIKSWRNEGGRYLNLALTVTHHPETNERNIGLYRVQIFNDNQLAINFSPQSGAGHHHAVAQQLGQPLPVRLLLGVDPALIWVAAAPLPDGCDELQFYRSVFEQKTSLAAASSQPLNDLVTAEIVIEGLILPEQTAIEGPYGNHTGHYVTREDCPLVKVTAVSHSDNPVVPLTVVGPPPSENIYLGRANEILIRALIKIDYPQVCDVWMPLETMFHGAAVVAVKNQSAAENKALIHDLWKTSPLSRSRFILLVSESVHRRDISTSWWRLVNGLKKQRIYVNHGRTAIDATEDNVAQIVREDPQINELLQQRRDQYQLW